MTPQPSPTNLSDELTTKLQSIIRMASRIGEDLMRNQILMDETVRQITAAYAEAMNEVIGSDEIELPFTETATVAQGLNAPTRNQLRAEQRHRLSALVGKDIRGGE